MKIQMPKVQSAGVMGRVYLSDCLPGVDLKTSVFPWVFRALLIVFILILNVESSVHFSSSTVLVPTTTIVFIISHKQNGICC